MHLAFEGLNSCNRLVGGGGGGGIIEEHYEYAGYELEGLWHRVYSGLNSSAMVLGRIA